MKQLMGLTILVLLGVVGWLLNWKGCNVGTTTGIQADTIINKHSDTTFIHDTAWRYKMTYIPLPGKIIYQTIPANIDTAAILKEYFAKRPYIDSTFNDSNVSIVVNDTLSRNAITSRSIKYRINRPDKVITNTVETTITKHDVSHHYYYGLCSSFNAKHYGLTSIVGGPQIGMGFIIGTTYNKANISVSYDVLRERVGFNYLIKIR